MTLKEARILFTLLLARLLMFLHDKGYQPALAEGMDRRTTKDPTTDHMKGSLHELGLAQDVDLYDASGNYLSLTEHHLDGGLFWESLHPYCHWGGRFGDGNHYSLSDASIPGCVSTGSGALKK